MNDNFNESGPLLGSRLRQLRKLRGLSLKELARRSGTSPSALHRYESGWDRFELDTLRRLASSLGARLQIVLEPLPRPAYPEVETESGLVTCLHSLFWDVDLTRYHLRNNADWVVRRVLQFGNWDQVHRTRRFFGDDVVRRAAEHRSMDARTRRLWRVVLGTGGSP
jgi:transcriptional regulator with XRE-family HTH domain